MFQSVPEECGVSSSAEESFRRALCGPCKDCKTVRQTRSVQVLLGCARLGSARFASARFASPRCLLGANFAQRLCIESRALEARCRPGRVSSALMREQFGSVRFMLARTLRVVVPSPNRSPSLSRSRSVSRSRQKTSRSPQSAPREARSRLVSCSSRFWLLLQ